MDRYYRGQTVDLLMRFRIASGVSVDTSDNWVFTLGALTDPSAGTVRYTDPSGNTATVAFASWTKISTGVFYASIVADEEGRWTWSVESTAGVVGVGRGEFEVIQSEPLT